MNLIGRRSISIYNYNRFWWLCGDGLSLVHKQNNTTEIEKSLNQNIIFDEK
jgi:hypothetical protein